LLAALRCQHQASAKELTALLGRPSLEGIPLLVLGNKNDVPGALGTAELIEQMGLSVRCVFFRLE
jgi:ADP-ribosylation factor-like protein 8